MKKISFAVLIGKINEIINHSHSNLTVSTHTVEGYVGHYIPEYLYTHLYGGMNRNQYTKPYSTDTVRLGILGAFHSLAYGLRTYVPNFPVRLR